MSVYFNTARQRWLYDFECGGKRHAGYCRDPKTGEAARNKTQAKRIEAAIRAAALEELEAQRRPSALPTVYTVAQMIAEFASRKCSGKNWVNEQVYVRELLEWFGADTPVDQLTEARIWDYVTWSRKQPLRVYMGAGKTKTELANGPKAKAPLFKEGARTRSDSTINRYLICLGSALRIAHSLRDGAGRLLLPELPKVPRLTEPQHLPRPISDENLTAIINHPDVPAHLADAALLVRLMGFRKAEVFGLRIQQVDFSVRGVWLEADATKAGRAECVPASDEALELLTRLVRQAREWKVDHLFTYQHGKKGERKPVKDPRRAWNTVMRRLGIKHRWHDTKASFVTAVA